MWRRALTLAVVALLAGTAAELTGEGRLPFDELRWRAGTPEILLDDRWLPLRAVQNIPAATLVADEIALEGPAFVDRFALDLERLVERHGERWGPLVALEVQDGEDVRSIHRLATGLRGRSFVRALDERSEPIGDRADIPIPPRIDGIPSWPYLSGLTHDAASADLGFLAWHLAHRLASPQTDVPWRNGLAAIRDGLDSAISRRDFAIQVMRVLAMFDDGHVRLKRTDSGIERSQHVLPVRFVAVSGGAACVTADEHRLCSDAYPLLLAIDGLSLPAIYRALAPLAPRVSPDFQRGEVLDLARDVELLHGLAGGAVSETSTLTLGDGKGREATQVVHNKRVTRTHRPASVDARVLPSGDGYLALRAGWPTGDSLVKEIDDAFRMLSKTRRLIIDVRRNQGGSREPVLHLLRHILPPGDRVIDVAAYRMDLAERPANSIDVLTARGFHAPTKLDEALLAAPRARWPLSPSQWSQWQVATIGAARDAPSYGGPIVVLVDEQSASATALLASALAPLDRVTIAGLQGGGGGGWPVEIRLPHSGLVVSLPSMFSVRPDGAPGVIMPEVRHVRSVDDLKREMSGEPVPSWALADLSSTAKLRSRAMHEAAASPLIR